MTTTAATEQAPAAPRAADRLDLRAGLILVVCCAAWGINQSAVKIANAGISPVLQAGLRSLLSGLLVFAWARARGIPLFQRDRTLWPGILAGLMFGAEFLVIYIGLNFTSASRGIVLLYLAPFVVAFGAHYLVPGDRLTLPKLIGLTAALVGLAVAMGEGLLAPGRPTMKGDLMFLAGAILWGATTVLVRASTLRSASPEKTLLYQLGVSAVMLLPASALLGEPGVVNPTPAVLAAFVYTFVVVAFVTYIAWFWLVRNYPPTRISAFSFLAPVFGVMAGNVMLGEPFTPSLGMALALVAFGIYLVNRPRRRP
ncbi:MAG TPA: DMT family transporter [Hyphomicrobiaceae bacterium]|nr:DMT family transporter [Hyphomicrobiaceae bacterium]